MNIFNSENNNETYYSILGVEQNASQEDIKRAYRKLSLNLHTDRDKGGIQKEEQYKKEVVKRLNQYETIWNVL